MIAPHSFWQVLHPPQTFPTIGPFADFYPATLDDGRQIQLPIRALADGRNGLASLIINQASFAVEDALADDLAQKLLPLRPDIVVGLPTLGLTLAAAVARKLGHSRYVPLGTSKKFWYDEGLSVPLSSITTPQMQKRLYVDPRMLPLLAGRRVALIDDVTSSGTSLVAGLTLLARCDFEPVVIGVAMLQSQRWRAALGLLDPVWQSRVLGVFSTPMLHKTDDGHWAA